MKLASFVLAILVVFGRSINGEWLFDDPLIPELADSGDFERGYGRPALWGWSWFRTERAMTAWTYWCTWRLFGLWRPAWHGVNLVLHTACIFLAYGVLVPVLGSWHAAVAATIFGFHPLQVSSVCYISGRAGMLATFFTLAGLMHFQLGDGWHYLLAVFSQWLAWRSKEDGLLYVAFYPMVWFFSGRI